MAPEKSVKPEEVEEVEEQDENTLTPDTVTKYQTAADIANRVLAKVMEAAVEGARVIDLCELGDKLILEAVKGVFAKKKNVTKGNYEIAI